MTRLLWNSGTETCKSEGICVETHGFNGMKFFCIGLTKTGTTSFNSLMGSIGYKTHGYSRKLLNEYLDGGGIGPNIRRAIDQHDAFDDWPWPFLYRELLQELGDDAVFVLTRRSSPEAWLASIKRYSLSARTQWIRQVTYGTEFPHGFEEHYLTRYNNHLKEVRAHFGEVGAMNQLIDVEIGTPEMLDAIAKLTNRHIPDQSVPRQNPTIPHERVARENIRKINRTLLGLGKQPITLQEAGFRES